jgi:hypothetical protein
VTLEAFVRLGQEVGGTRTGLSKPMATAA